MESTAALKRRTARILEILHQTYPGATCELEHENAYQLVVATILSAQCTDKRVNMVTPALFRRYPDARALAAADPPELEGMIQSTGFYRNKAKSLLGMAATVVNEHGGEVPDEMAALTTLPGVGRKTANVVLGTAFGKNEGVVVDTHVGRLTRLLGLTDEEDPEKVERAMMAVVPREEWTNFSHLLIHHGRNVCIARRPVCDACPLYDLCPGRRPLHGGAPDLDVAPAGLKGSRKSSVVSTKQTAAKQTTAKQTAAKQTTAKQTAAKQTAAKQTTAKQTKAKQTTAKRTATRQTAAKQSATEQTAERQAAQSRAASNVVVTGRDKPNPTASTPAPTSPATKRAAATERPARGTDPKSATPSASAAKKQTPAPPPDTKRQPPERPAAPRRRRGSSPA